MKAEELRTAVLQEAKKEAVSLIEAATAEVSALVEQEKNRINREDAASLAEYRAAADRRANVRAVSMRVTLRNALLERKQKLLEQVYAELMQSVRDDAKLYRAFLVRALGQIGPDTPTSIECRAEDQAQIKKLLTKRNDAANIRINPVLSDPDGGLMVKFPEGDVDLTLSAACAALKEETLVETAKALFSEKP